MLIPAVELRLLYIHSIDVKFNPPISIGPFILCFDTFVRPLLTFWLSSLAQNSLLLSFSSLSSCFDDSGIDCSAWFSVDVMPSFIRFLFLMCFFC